MTLTEKEVVAKLQELIPAHYIEEETDMTGEGDELQYHIVFKQTETTFRATLAYLVEEAGFDLIDISTLHDLEEKEYYENPPTGTSISVSKTPTSDQKQVKRVKRWLKQSERKRAKRLKALK